MLEAPSKSDLTALLARALAAEEDVRRTAAIQRMRNRERSPTDGPFAETKEHLGGSS